MARPKLSSLLTETTTAADTESPALPTRPAPRPAPARPAPEPEAEQRPRGTAQPARPDTTADPRSLELVRKEARFTDDQLQEPTMLTRQLNKARQGTGERLTDNTLIRVAVDLLLKERAASTESQKPNSGSP